MIYPKIWFCFTADLYRRRRSLALQSRSKSAAPTAGGRRPVGHVDPRRPSTSSVASGGRRLVSNEERNQHHRARRERSRISRASSIDRMSVSSGNTFAMFHILFFGGFRFRSKELKISYSISNKLVSFGLLSL